MNEFDNTLEYQMSALTDAYAQAVVNTNKKKEANEMETKGMKVKQGEVLVVPMNNGFLLCTNPNGMGVLLTACSNADDLKVKLNEYQFTDLTQDRVIDSL